MAIAPASPEPAPVPADYMQQSLQLMIQVRELGRTVDGFRFTVEGRRAVIGSLAALPEEYLHRTAAMLDVNPDLAVACELTSTEIRECLNFKREFGNAASEIHLVARGVEDTIAEKMANVCERARKVYHYAKRTDLRGATESLVPHLEAMARALGLGRKKKKALPPGPPVVPFPVTKGDAK